MLAYGMTEYKLAADVEISVKAAIQLILDYFSAFPKIGILLNYFGKFGVEKGFIQTIAPFFRKRFFPEWKNISKSAIEMHVAGIEHNYKLAEIERASKNAPIQGGSADMSKVACIMVRWYIQDNNLWDRVKMLMQIHDSQDTVARDDYKEEWAEHLQRIMEEAALFIIPNGLVKADVGITERWSK